MRVVSAAVAPFSAGSTSTVAPVADRTSESVRLHRNSLTSYGPAPVTSAPPAGFFARSTSSMVPSASSAALTCAGAAPCAIGPVISPPKRRVNELGATPGVVVLTVAVPEVRAEPFTTGSAASPTPLYVSTQRCAAGLVTVAVTAGVSAVSAAWTSSAVALCGSAAVVLAPTVRVKLPPPAPCSTRTVALETSLGPGEVSAAPLTARSGTLPGTS